MYVTNKVSLPLDERYIKFFRKEPDMRLLLAEDEREMSNALVAVLKHNNYSVDAICDSQNAMD